MTISPGLQLRSHAHGIITVRRICVRTRTAEPVADVISVRGEIMDLSLEYVQRLIEQGRAL